MYKCLNHWNNYNDLDGYCRGNPEFVELPNEEEVSTGRIRQKCKCNPQECLNFQTWLEVCEQNRGNILWLQDKKKVVTV